MAALNIDALFDAIGGFFGAINQTMSLAGNAIGAVNTTDNTSTLASIVLLALVVFTLGTVWKGAGGPKVTKWVQGYR